MITNTSTYNEFLKNWVNIYKRPYIKSWKDIKNNIRLHIPDRIKRCRMCNLNVFDIQSAINDIPTSRLRLELYHIYHGSLHFAFMLGLTVKDLSTLIVKPKHIQKVGSSLSEEEISFLLKNDTHRYRFFYRFCLYSGCRRSEVLNLCNDDIDFALRLIHIRGTKNKTSDRYIPIFDDLLTLFIEMTAFYGTFPIGRIFKFSKQRVSVEFSSLLPGHKLHDLRHTFATRCLECGVNLSVVQKWLGHSSILTTSNIYSHILPEFEKSELEKIRW